MSLIRLKLNTFCKVSGQKRSKIMIFLIFMNLDVSTCWWLKIKSRPPKLKIWVEILLRNHVKSISSKYELDPTDFKYILQGYRSKKVINHDFFDLNEFGRLDLLMANSAWCGFRNLGFRSKPVAQLGNGLEMAPKGLKSGLELCASCGSNFQFFWKISMFQRGDPLKKWKNSKKFELRSAACAWFKTIF